jgi:uncharacterized protein YraI
MKTTLLATVAAVLLSAGAASAAPAITSSAVNLRSGPGTQYPVITTLPGRVAVNVSGCNDSWCAVNWNGTNGYVNAGYLDTAGAPAAVVAAPGYYQDEGASDDYAVGPSYGYFGYDNGPSWRHRDHANWRGSRPGPVRAPVIGRPSVSPQPGFAGPPANWRGNPGIGQGFGGT